MARREENLQIVKEFYPIRDLIKSNPLDKRINHGFLSLSKTIANYLNGQCDRKDCESNSIPGKNYFYFIQKSNHEDSRAINKDLFSSNLNEITPFLKGINQHKFTEFAPHLITKICYSLAIGFASIVDMNNPGDQQTPGNFYEYLVKYLLCNFFQASPTQSRVTVPVGKDDVQLTMDLVFIFDAKKIKLNIAIKNSTRERGSEFWAQQRILEQAFGNDSYKALFFGLAETKKNSQTQEVIEICVPDQWRAYQQYISTIDNFYYLDPPIKYLQLNESEPKLNVKEFGQFFSDWYFLLSS